MDDSNGEGNRPQGGSSSSRDGPPRGNLIYAERLRERLESISKDAQVLGELSKPYREEAREQINRALPQGNWPAHLSITGVTRDKIVAHGEGLISALAGTNGRSLESQQVEAVAESLMANARSTSLLQWGMYSGTMFLAYIHRKKMPSRIPGKTSSLFRYLWPGMLFVVYSIPVSLFVSPVVLALNAKYHAKRFRKDKRLQGINLDLSRKLHQYRHGSPDGNAQFSDQGYEAPQDYPTSSPSSYSEVARAAAPAWGKSASTAPAPPPQRQQSSSSNEPSGWGFDDDDDASPIAPSSRGSYDSGLSAWDRVRIQSGGQQRQAPARPAHQPPQAASGGWGQEQSQRSTDSYSSSSSDQYGSRSQAQADFDALLERERHGDERGRGSSWGK